MLQRSAEGLGQGEEKAAETIMPHAGPHIWAYTVMWISHHMHVRSER